MPETSSLEFQESREICGFLICLWKLEPPDPFVKESRDPLKKEKILLLPSFLYMYSVMLGPCLST